MKRDEATIERLFSKHFFRINEAATIVGEDPHVLRYWEEVFGIKVERKSSGQRCYGRNDILKLIRIRRLVREEKFTLEGARRQLRKREP